ncbi:unnamed protein product [Ambrosiozyma monospora]|uniref:Unnamed protein product n=1 Tax=Ambrosiozyma monospora TaxID=43982 RepID=A0ACB5T3V2_AMBMO|nr:unnamed protein product [Ambrosiozyma monospora]
MCGVRGFWSWIFSPVTIQQVSTIDFDVEEDSHTYLRGWWSCAYAPQLCGREVTSTSQRNFSSSSFSFNKTVFQQPTIYALSTAPSRAAIAVIRVSGPATLSIYKALTRSQGIPKHRQSTVRKLYHPDITGRGGSIQQNKQILDESLLLYFKSPRSFTGEDVLELHVHGGTAVVNGVLKAIQSLHDPNSTPVRYAEHGEFSKRAFQNGKFDLTEVEGINDLIHADTETQRLSALESMQGGNKNLFQSWRTEIVNDVALLTTVIDFGEDHDVDEAGQLFDRVDGSIRVLQQEVEQYLKKVTRSQILLDGIKVTLLGPPNAGKSSLLNLIANEDKAIVSDVAGTTRDAIDVPLDINGFKVVVGDTAGIRDAMESSNAIEAEGIKRAKLKSADAHMNLMILPVDVDFDTLGEELIDHLKTLNEQEQENSYDSAKKLTVILNKSDLLRSEEEKSGLLKTLSAKLGIAEDQFKFISCLTGDDSKKWMISFWPPRV